MNYQCFVPSPQFVPLVSDYNAVVYPAKSTPVAQRHPVRSETVEHKAPAVIEVQLHGPVAPGWEVVQQLPVVIEEDEDGVFVASDKVFFVYGAGDNQEEALEDYSSALQAYYRILEGHATEDDPPTQGLFRYLQKYLRPYEE